MKTVTHTIPYPSQSIYDKRIIVKDTVAIVSGTTKLRIKIDNLIRFREITHPYLKIYVNFGDGSQPLELHRQTGFKTDDEVPILEHVFESTEYLQENYLVKLSCFQSNLESDEYWIRVRIRRPKIKSYEDVNLLKAHIFDVDADRYGVLLVAGFKNPDQVGNVLLPLSKGLLPQPKPDYAVILDETIEGPPFEWWLCDDCPPPGFPPVVSYSCSTTQRILSELSFPIPDGLVYKNCPDLETLNPNTPAPECVHVPPPIYNTLSTEQQREICPRRILDICAIAPWLEQCKDPELNPCAAIDCNLPENYGNECCIWLQKHCDYYPPNWIVPAGYDPTLLPAYETLSFEEFCLDPCIIDDSTTYSPGRTTDTHSVSTIAFGPIVVDVEDPIPPSEFLTTWDRFVGNAYYPDPYDPALPAPASTWYYQTQPKPTFVQPVNSGTPNGFISNTFDAYFTLDCVIHSNSADDDGNGVIAAFHHGSSVNKYLAFVTTHAGVYPRFGWGIQYWDGSSYSTFGVDLSPPHGPGSKNTPGWTGGYGWGGQPAAGYPNRTGEHSNIRVRVERDGDKIRAWCSAWGAATLRLVDDFTLNPESIIECDLTTGTITYGTAQIAPGNVTWHADKHLFTGGKSQHGLWNYSQAGSRFYDIRYSRRYELGNSWHRPGIAEGASGDVASSSYKLSGSYGTGWDTASNDGGIYAKPGDPGHDRWNLASEHEYMTGEQGALSSQFVGGNLPTAPFGGVSAAPSGYFSFNVDGALIDPKPAGYFIYNVDRIIQYTSPAGYPTWFAEGIDLYTQPAGYHTWDVEGIDLYTQPAGYHTWDVEGIDLQTRLAGKDYDLIFDTFDLQTEPSGKDYDLIFDTFDLQTEPSGKNYHLVFDTFDLQTEITGKNYHLVFDTFDLQTEIAGKNYHLVFDTFAHQVTLYNTVLYNLHQDTLACFLDVDGNLPVILKDAFTLFTTPTGRHAEIDTPTFALSSHLGEFRHYYLEENRFGSNTGMTPTALSTTMHTYWLANRVLSSALIAGDGFYINPSLSGLSGLSGYVDVEIPSISSSWIHEILYTENFAWPLSCFTGLYGGHFVEYDVGAQFTQLYGGHLNQFGTSEVAVQLYGGHLNQFGTSEVAVQLYGGYFTYFESMEYDTQLQGGYLNLYGEMSLSASISGGTDLLTPEISATYIVEGSKTTIETQTIISYKVEPSPFYVWSLRTALFDQDYVYMCSPACGNIPVPNQEYIVTFDSTRDPFTFDFTGDTTEYLKVSGGCDECPCIPTPVTEIAFPDRFVKNINGLGTYGFLCHTLRDKEIAYTRNEVTNQVWDGEKWLFDASTDRVGLSAFDSMETKLLGIAPDEGQVVGQSGVVDMYPDVLLLNLHSPIEGCGSITWTADRSLLPWPLYTQSGYSNARWWLPRKFSVDIDTITVDTEVGC
jgi:hypothetical protein